MGSNADRARKALNAMKGLGFSKKLATSVLKGLLSLYGNNWELIEDENYRVLADAILDKMEKESTKQTADEEMGAVEEEPEAHGTRRARQEDQHASASASGYGVEDEVPLKRPKLESVEPALVQSTQEVQEASATSPRGTGPVSPESSRRETRAVTRARQAAAAQSESTALVAHKRMKEPVQEKSSNVICLKEPKTEPGIDTLQGVEASSSQNASVGLITEPLNSDPSDLERPLAMMCPDPTLMEKRACKNRWTQQGRASRISTSPAGAIESATRQGQNQKNGSDHAVTLCNSGPESGLVNTQEATCTDLDIASSTRGEVKMSLKCSADHPNFRMPSLETVFKMVEDRCLRSYKILPPDFSIGSLMNDICQCVVELGNDPAADNNDHNASADPAMASRINSGEHINGSTLPKEAMASNVPFVNPIARKNGGPGRGKTTVVEDSENGLQRSLVPHQPHLALSELRPLHDVNDISKGEERVRIPVVNEFGSEKYPPSFYYIPKNLVYQNAYVNISVARIGDEDCCSDCFGDCLSSPIPCACTRETGGEFAYTPDGLVKKAFLEECISMNRFPEKHHKFYCKACPLERSKNEASPDSCKGHLVRRFIKECWSKCGCNMQCGNRVVQRGITCNLQVFFTSEGKGWGLRTLDDLPKGAFVCEYVGEVVTNTELYERTVESTSNDKHTYPVLLDADWGSEGVLKDEEALCLDATFYGNVGRFVNHRCYDANLVEIPVEVETPDHHYYHLAFFTSRKVEAFEELTWDYGIDFDDLDHPVKAFRCRCGSRYCRDLKRTRSRGKAVSK